MHLPRLARAALLAGIVVAGAALVPSAEAEPVSGTPYYVALGDSYTAAPLISRPVGQFSADEGSEPRNGDGFNDSDNPYDCGKSDFNYPHLVAERLGLYSPTDPAQNAGLEHTYDTHPGFIDISCGSARTKHLYESQTAAYNGVNRPQLDALRPASEGGMLPDDATVTLVTMGMGGNDIGFGSIVDQCIQPPTQLGGQPCSEHYIQDGVDTMRQKIDELVPVLVAAVADIRALAPRAEIVLFGYPALLPEEPLVEGLPEGCYPYIPLLPEDVPYLRGVNKYLNEGVARAAELAGAHYVDWYTPSIGHDACQPPGVAWTNGAVVVPPSFPAHPNILGTMGGAEAGWAELQQIGFDFTQGRPLDDEPEPEHPGRRGIDRRPRDPDPHAR